MDPIATRKIHFAPLRRQERQIRRLLEEGGFRNVTHLMRAAIDHFLDRRGRPTLAVQAQRMAEDFHRGRGEGTAEAEAMQDPSRDADERW
jgi:Arc/MetJ-type ribon-helix-helix transcriptional regulator